MKEIYLIRHSAPFVEIDNYKDYNSIDWEEYNRNMILSPEGEDNAKKLNAISELKNIDSIYASNSCRAIATAKYLAAENNLKIKLDSRINERALGCQNIGELPEDYSMKSFENKDLKFKNGESLNEVDKRFNDFMGEIINNQDEKTVLVIHGMILLSYFQQFCNFNFDGKILKMEFNGDEVINRKFKAPDVFKLTIDNGNIISIKSIEVK